MVDGPVRIFESCWISCHELLTANLARATVEHQQIDE